MYLPTQLSDWIRKLAENIITPPFTSGTCTASKIQFIKKAHLYTY